MTEMERPTILLYPRCFGGYHPNFTPQNWCCDTCDVQMECSELVEKFKELTTLVRLRGKASGAKPASCPPCYGWYHKKLSPDNDGCRTCTVLEKCKGLVGL